MALVYQVTPIAAFTDNYIWAIHDEQFAWVVDPGDAAPVLAWLQRSGRLLAGMLLTHHHADHIGGVAALLGRCGPLPVYGPADRRLPATVAALADGDHLDIEWSGAGGRLALEVMAVPGHTATHIAFYAAAPGWLFCGDTLFSVGCGRLFEGTAAEMQTSLDRLAALPAATRVYCAHEYTAANCRFALAVEPDNPALRARATEVETLRAAGQPTLPSTIGCERDCNPFLRSREPAVVAAARRHEPDAPATAPAEVLAVIRRWKDRF